MLGGKMMLEFKTYTGSIEGIQAPYGIDRLVLVGHDKARQPIFQNFGDRPAVECDDRRSTRHRLDHYQSEGLAPRYREEKSRGIAQEFLLLVLADLTNEFDVAFSQ